MTTRPAADLADFHRFLSEKVRNGQTSLSPEQALDEWRTHQPDPLAIEEDLAAIQEALDDARQGDVGVLMDEFDRDFRARHNLPSKP